MRFSGSTISPKRTPNRSPIITTSPLAIFVLLISISSGSPANLSAQPRNPHLIEASHELLFQSDQLQLLIQHLYSLKLSGSRYLQICLSLFFLSHLFLAHFYSLFH